jgi:uncharacterized membrane protein YvbJ
MMKTCPICGAKAAPDAYTCFDCYYSFHEMSARAVDDLDRRFLKRPTATPPLDPPKLDHPPTDTPR